MVCVLKALCLHHCIISVVAALTAKIDGSKTIDGHIGALIDRHKAHHLLLCDVRLENCLAPDPVCALFRNRFLRQFITQFYFKLGAIQATLS